MARLFVLLVCTGLTTVLLAVGCAGRATPTPEPASSAAASVAATTGEAGRLSVLGTVLPARALRLGFHTGGPIKMLHVQMGIDVEQGELLAELDTADLALMVREAKEALALSQARLAQAQAGARRQEVEIAQAEYERALAQHQALLDGNPPEEVSAAQADYQAALAHYQEVKLGAGAQELIAARADLEKAGIALKRAQAAYDLVAGRPDVGASPQAAALHEATVDYEAAKAHCAHLEELPSESELQAARAQLAHAEAQLKLAQAGPSDHEVMASASSVAITQARLALVKSGPRLEDVAVAEAQVRQARTAVERAEMALAQAQLWAPFDGTISAVYVHPGEWATPGAPVVELLDTNGWRVETRNVGELDIGRVHTGQEAIVRVIAFSGQELRGRVVAISPAAVVQQGDTTYTVFIELEPTDLGLRPGMNVVVEIETGC